MSDLKLEIDLTEGDNFLAGTPHAFFKELRQQDPVYWNPRHDGGPGIWCITKYADVAEVGSDWERFTSTRGVSILRHTPEEAARSAGSLLIFMDPPRHTKLRQILAAAFSPRRIASLEPRIRHHAQMSINRVIEQGECNFFDVAAELPIRMICDLLGIPEKDHLRVLDWTNRTFGHEDAEYSSGPEDKAQAYMEMYAYAQQMTAERRANPTDDVMSAVANATIDGEPITEAEVNNMFFLLAGAGNDTTRTLILNSMRLFGENPDIWQELRADRSLIPNAIEENLRLAPSARGMGRTVTRDTVLRGKTLKAGDQLYLWYVSSNRDEEVFKDPDRFDMRRPNVRQHQAFGGGGAHFCIGASLARMQTRILIDLLLDRMPQFEVVGNPVFARSVQFNTLKQLPLKFKPGPIVESALA